METSESAAQPSGNPAQLGPAGGRAWRSHDPVHAGAVIRLFDWVLAWIDRMRQRRRLVELDDRLLTDIGLSRADVEREIALRFWWQRGNQGPTRTDDNQSGGRRSAQL